MYKENEILIFLKNSEFMLPPKFNDDPVQFSSNDYYHHG